MNNIHRGREHLEDAGRLSSALGSPAVQAIRSQATLTDMLRSKQTIKTCLNSLEPYFLYPFCPSVLR